MIKFNPTTPIKFYVKESAYTKGEGASAEWHPITTNTDTFYSEWRGTFGDRLTVAQAIGVSDSATIRTFYNPAIYDALQTKQVLIIKKCRLDSYKNGTLDKTMLTYTRYGRSRQYRRRKSVYGVSSQEVSR